MTITIKTDRTPEAIRKGIERMMNENKRKRTFVAVAECLGNTLICGPESDYSTHFAQFHGVQGIRRECWGIVPNYAERVCNHLAGLMQGERITLN